MAKIQRCFPRIPGKFSTLINTRTRKVAKPDPLAEIKDALAAGTLTGPEAIDRAYRLGFEAGESAARKAA